ncbi:MAG: hypothetical protein GWN29_07620, partial [Gammaproteobacteria bacterium]|nr:hypothetical protein [Gammaproteobacteria bacterium]
FDFGAQFIPNADSSELFLLLTGDLEYEFRDIADTRFVPQIELEACKPYTWTVRARFVVDGRTHLTHWSGNYDEDE